MPVPDNDKGGVHGMQRLEAFAWAAAENAEADATGALVYSDDPAVADMIATSVEFTRLFIGPPRPAADPWETVNDPYNDKKVGYGRATVAMQRFRANVDAERSEGYCSALLEYVDGVLDDHYDTLV